jgi:hypothetical protein
MKNKISYIITTLLLSIGFAYIQAEPLFPSAQLEPQPMQSAQVMPTTGYNGTVYAPFDASAPSEQSQANANQAPGRPGHIRKGLIGGPEDPLGPSPIGEPWVLAIFAIAFAGVVALRKRKNTTL